MFLEFKDYVRFQEGQRGWRHLKAVNIGSFKGDSDHQLEASTSSRYCDHSSSMRLLS